MSETCVHHWIIQEGGRQPGRCRKCGTTRNFGRTFYDHANMVTKHQEPPPDPRDKVLAFLKDFNGVRVDWGALRKAAGCSYNDLGNLVATLKREGLVEELAPFMYAIEGVEH